jgi:hypothetical protein
LIEHPEKSNTSPIGGLVMKANDSAARHAVREADERAAFDFG